MEIFYKDIQICVLADVHIRPIMYIVKITAQFALYQRVGLESVTE